jgi:hypothetical protein
MDVQFWWVNDRVKQGQFHVYWGPYYQYLADYFKKHHSPTYHDRMREIYIHASERPMNQKRASDGWIGREFEIPHFEGVFIPNARMARAYSISPGEMWYAAYKLLSLREGV